MPNDAPQTHLFDNLPDQDSPLPTGDAALLVSLPEWPAKTEVDHADHASCRRLERRGLVKVSRQKMDPIAIEPTRSSPLWRMSMPADQTTIRTAVALPPGSAAELARRMEALGDLMRDRADEILRRHMEACRGKQS